MLRTLLLIGPAFLIALGCGGSDASSKPSVARFAGNYIGTWHSVSESGDGTNGTIKATIDSQGAISGSVSDSVLGTGTLEASLIKADGQAQFVAVYPSPDDVPFANQDGGRLSRNASGDLSGTLAREAGDVSIPHFYTLIRQAE